MGFYLKIFRSTFTCSRLNFASMSFPFTIIFHAYLKALGHFWLMIIHCIITIDALLLKIMSRKKYFILFFNVLNSYIFF